MGAAPQGGVIPETGRMGKILEQWVWGSGLLGFRKASWGGDLLIVIREGLDPHWMAERVLGMRPKSDGMSLYAGRAVLGLLELGDGDTVLVRPYRRGGVPRWITEDLFFTWPARPFKELVLTERARLKGIPTVEIFAALVKRIWGPLYRGWLVSRRLEGAEDFWSALRRDYGTGTRKLVLQAVAEAVHRMHSLGIYHADLNLRNILVRQETDRIAAYIIDFDRARFFPGRIPSSRVNDNLNRLLRSAQKLDPRRRYLSEDDWALFVDLYHRSR